MLYYSRVKVISKGSDGVLLVRTPLFQKLVVDLTPLDAVDQLLPLLEVERVF